MRTAAPLPVILLASTSVVIAYALGGCAATSGGLVGSPPPITRTGDPVPAVEIADSVMDRMGGKRAWDRTWYITFTFFGNRRHLWDKQSGDVRIEGTDRESGEQYLILMNLHTGQGNAWKSGAPVTDPSEAEAMLERGRRAWINDTYWLVMPYKLRDPGVILRTLGRGLTEDGSESDVLEVTFDNVGVTPQNKYHVYVARDSGLVEQWDFYPTADAKEPTFKIPWRDWHRHGDILLSGDRGPRAQLTNIAVLDDVDRSAFTDPATPIPHVP